MRRAVLAVFGYAVSIRIEIGDQMICIKTFNYRHVLINHIIDIRTHHISNVSFALWLCVCARACLAAHTFSPSFILGSLQTEQMMRNETKMHTAL